MPKGIPLTKEEQARRRKEIFDASVHLFLDKGFNETSMNEIAQAAGMGKSTLYDYFKSKDEILVSYYADEITKITERGYEITRLDIPVSEKLKMIMETHLAYLLDNKHFHLRLSSETQRLSSDSQQFIHSQRKTYRELLQGLIEDGIRAGEFRPINTRFAARCIYTLLSIAAFSNPSASPEKIMEESMQIFFTGIENQ